MPSFNIPQFKEQNERWIMGNREIGLLQLGKVQEMKGGKRKARRK